MFKLKLYQQIILKKYLKLFLIVFFSITMFFTSIDFIMNIDGLPKSANLQVLYFVNMFMFFSSMAFVLSVLFSMVGAVISLLKENELVVLYSLGASKNMIVKEFLKIVSLLVLIFWVLNNFSFYTSASEIASNIYHYSQATKYESNLLLKSKDKYIYIAKLNKFKKEGNDIQIFNTSRVELKSIITAKKAIYSNNFWILKDVKVVKIPKLDDTIEGKKLNISYHDSMKTLEGFKPSFMDSLYKKAKGLTIWEGFVAINYLKDKGLSIKSIKSNLYKNIFFPLFSLFFSIILFFKLPIQKRGVSLAGVSAKFYFIALFGWGIIFLFEKLSENGIGYPEFLIVLPIMIVGVYSFLNYKKYSY